MYNVRVGLHHSQITGKAVMLEEIINYVQSLQRQIEVRLEIVHYKDIALVNLIDSLCSPKNHLFTTVTVCSSCQ